MTPPNASKAFCILVWLIAISLPVALLAGIFVPWSNKLAELDHRIETGENQLTRLRRLALTRPMLEAELREVRSNDDFKSFYFDARTQALAGAQLQSKVQDIVTAAEGRLISTQLLPQEKGADPPRVRVRTQIRGNSASLLEILYQIEQARPFLFVERLSVRSSARPSIPTRTNRTGAVRRPRSPDGGDLTIRVDIFGYALGENS